MQGRSLIAILVLLPLAVPLGSAQTADTSDLAINVVSAEDLGCTDDSLAGPADLRVTVRVDGQERLQTVKAQDQEAPEYAAFTVVQAVEMPATIEVIIEEAEPGGFFGLGTSWETCDAASGTPTTYETSWSGDQQEIVARGDGDRAAEASLVLGPDAPTQPELTEAAVGTDEVTVAWEATSGEGVTGHRLRLAPVGEELHEAGPGAGQHTARDLCDNTPYTFQLIRDAEPWHIGSEPLEVTTDNRAPEAPIVLEADTTDGNLTVAWLLPTSHDLEQLALHAGTSATFQTDASTQVATYRAPLGFQPVETTVEDPPAEATYVRVVATDTGGLSATSEAFAIGDDPVDPATIPESEDADCPGAADRLDHTSSIHEAQADEEEPGPSGPPEDDRRIEERQSPDPTMQDPAPSDADPQEASEPAEDDLGGVGVWVGLVAGIALTLAVVALILVATGQL